MKIRDKIKQLRLKKNMTQEQLAEKAGLTCQYINYIENGKRENPRRKTLENICLALGVSLAELESEIDLDPSHLSEKEKKIIELVKLNVDWYQDLIEKMSIFEEKERSQVMNIVTIKVIDKSFSLTKYKL